MKNFSESYKKNRENLIALSTGARLLVKEGEADSVNEVLIDMYKQDNPEIKEFNTFHQWKKLGKTIKKGSKAFLVWAQPKDVKKQEPQPDTGETEEYQYWPICYLFADTQVN